MQHWFLLGLLCWGFLSVPLCVMFGRMFSVGNDSVPEFHIDHDAADDEFF
jgi:hypothetical protein